MSQIPEKLKLEGFNNLTKTLSLNLYDICFTGNAAQKQAYMAYIDKAYSAERLTGILSDLAAIIGASILHIAPQDYHPHGASVTMMIAEEPMTVGQFSNAPLPQPRPGSAVVAHLDKSHLTAHTYPESHPESEISSLRLDIDVSTCGLVSPLKALNPLIHSLEPDILTLDYRVRGFTRDVGGHKHFIDHEIGSIQDHLSSASRNRYRMVDVNLQRENIFHTRMMLREIRLHDYLGCLDRRELPGAERARIRRVVRREMEEIYCGRNLKTIGD